MRTVIVGLAILVAMLGAVSGCGMQGSSTPSPAAMTARFERVGYFKSDGMHGFTYFVQNPNEADIRAFSEAEKARFGWDKGRILDIDFFDDRAATPDVTLEYYFPESSDSAHIADFFANPHNGQSRLDFLKSIPKAL